MRSCKNCEFHIEYLMNKAHSQSILNVENKEMFQQAIESGHSIVYFYADWCAPCKAIAPGFTKISEAYKTYNFIKANVENLHDIASEYEIRSIPTFIFFNDSKEINRVSSSDIDVLKSVIEKDCKLTKSAI